MALSQKHHGKLLTPWYNRAEWALVHNLIYSNDAKNKQNNLKKAYEIMLIWKARSPILFAGVEGTLIIISALLQEYTEDTMLNVQVFYCSAVMRFVNIICATEDTKQASIFKTAKNKEVPDWIINIRHQFAHGQKLASFSILQKAVEFCLDWLQQQYWKPEVDNLRDCEIHQNRNFENDLKLLMTIYQSIVINKTLHKKVKYLQDFPRDVQNLLKASIYSILKIKPRSRSSVTDLLQEFWKYILNLVNPFNLDNFINNMSEQLIHLLDISNYKDKYESGISKKCSRTFELFVKVLSPLLIDLEKKDILNQIILNFIKHSLKSEDFDGAIASMWLKEIFYSFLADYLKFNRQVINYENENEVNGKHHNIIKFDMKLELEFSKYNFKNWNCFVMDNPNRNVLIYCYPLLRLSGYNNEASLHQSQLVSVYCKSEEDFAAADEKTFNATDLMNLLPSNIKNEFMIKLSKDIPADCKLKNGQRSDNGVGTILNGNAEKINNPVITKINDPLMFLGYPLGLLPGQEAVNPVLMDI